MKPNYRQRESEIEKKVKAYAEKMGWIARKFTSPGHRFVPDAIFFRWPARTFFIEFKAPDEKPSKAQFLEHNTLRHEGFKVYVVDNIGDGMNIIDNETQKCVKFVPS